MPPQVAALYLVISMLVGVLGRRYRFGFWGYFFSSLLLSPLIGLLLVIASKPLSHRTMSPRDMLK
ncbi:MAG: hypothetical protein LBP22_04780 [Deltaproteobacteria bacterium]|jgi:hypothetical protein|nr:hypothetical protein [Deltaproteobacteria bacterium]